MSAAEELGLRRRVLVVDDDPEIVTFLATLLELEGIDSTVATSAAAALEKLDHVVPTLVLRDIAMPDRDGLDLCRALKKDPRTREVPVFVVSARPGKDVVERALAAGAEEFIRKPFENQELIARIRGRLRALRGGSFLYAWWLSLADVVVQSADGRRVSGDPR